MNKKEMSQVLMEKAASVVGRIKEGEPHTVREVELATAYSREKRSMSVDLEDGTTLVIMLWAPIHEEES